MSDGLNKVMLLGNLGADPELKMTPNGQAILKMRLATTESYLDRNKQRQERTEWHTVTLWGKRAEALAKFLTKGNRLFVEGGIRTSTYDDKDGNKRYKTEVVASNVILAGGKGGGRSADSGGDDDRDTAPGQARHPVNADGEFSDSPGAADMDDIPFAPIADIG
jgi:single-strand DNA-binding protein